MKIVLVSAFVAVFAAQASAVTYDAVTGYSITNGNPNGVWSYGVESQLVGGAFSAFNVAGTNTYNLDTWAFTGSLGDPYPGIYKNNTASAQTGAGTYTLQAGQLALHPNNALNPQQYTVLRFTAQTTGLYNYNASFTGLDDNGRTTTDVHVVTSSASLYNNTVDGPYGSSVDGSGSVFLQAGQTLSVAVGNGGVNYFYDTTGVTFNVSSVPGPVAAVPFLIGLARSSRRRRKA